MTDQPTSPLVIPVPNEASGPANDAPHCGLEPPGAADCNPTLGTGRLREDVTMNDQDYGMMKMQLIQAGNAAHSRRVDGADAYAENLRYDYLEGKDKLSFPESTGIRNTTGPHPQFGSPDGK